MTVVPERFFRALLEASSDAILISRIEDGRIVEASRSLAELTGYVEVRISIGAARILPGVPAAAVMREADHRMYEDKLRAGQLRR